jgi:hypothetical protein
MKTTPVVLVQNNASAAQSSQEHSASVPYQIMNQMSFSPQSTSQHSQNGNQILASQA